MNNGASREHDDGAERNVDKEHVVEGGGQELPSARESRGGVALGEVKQ